MFTALAERVFGSANARYVKKLETIVDAINALESEIEALDDAALKERTNWLRDRHAAGAVGAVPTSPVYDDEGNLQTDFFDSSVAPTTRGDAGHLKVSRAHPM